MNLHLDHLLRWPCLLERLLKGTFARSWNYVPIRASSGSLSGQTCKAKGRFIGDCDTPLPVEREEDLPELVIMSDELGEFSEAGHWYLRGAGE